MDNLAQILLVEDNNMDVILTFGCIQGSKT